MFDPLQAVNASFSAFGVACVLDPDGVADDVLVIPQQNDRDIDFGTSRVLEGSDVFEIRAFELRDRGKDMEFTVSGKRYRVQSPPEFTDAHRYVAVLNAVVI